jgi:hypothetical protein
MFCPDGREPHQPKRAALGCQPRWQVVAEGVM